jgi:hypothetical protein
MFYLDVTHDALNLSAYNTAAFPATGFASDEPSLVDAHPAWGRGNP